MTVEMPTLCFAGRCELALLSLRVGQTSVGSDPKAITPQALVTSAVLYNRQHEAAPKLVPAHIPAAWNVSRVSSGKRVKPPTL